MFKFNPGDKVFIVDKVENVGNRVMNWSDYMEKFLNDNVKYGIVKRYRNIDDCYELDNGYIYLAECLSPILVKGKKIKKKRVPKIKSFKAAFKQAIAKSKTVSNLCSFGIQTNDGSRIFRVNDICFAAARVHAQGISEFVMDLTRTEKDLEKWKIPLKEWKPYAEYILKRSPWSSVFKYNSIGMAMRYGLPFDTNRSLSEIVSAGIALREGTEFADKLKVFNKLRKIKGISENAAYIISCSFECDEKFTIAKRRSWGAGHHALTIDSSFDGLMKFFANGFNWDKPPAKVRADSYSVFECAAKVVYDRNGKTVNKFIIDNVEIKEKGEGWRTIKYTPFDNIVNLAKLIDAEIAERKAA